MLSGLHPSFSGEVADVQHLRSESVKVGFKMMWFFTPNNKHQLPSAFCDEYLSTLAHAGVLVSECRLCRLEVV